MPTNSLIGTRLLTVTPTCPSTISSSSSVLTPLNQETARAVVRPPEFFLQGRASHGMHAAEPDDLAAPHEPPEPGVRGKLLSPNSTVTADAGTPSVSRSNLRQYGIGAGADIGHVGLHRRPARAHRWRRGPSPARR